MQLALLQDLLYCGYLEPEKERAREAETYREKEVAQEKLSNDILLLIINGVVSFFGKSPGIDGNLNVIPKSVMQTTTNILNYFINAVASFLE